MSDDMTDQFRIFRRASKIWYIEGVSLHSHRYAWAERARTAGYPERFAQEAPGHNSKAVHRAYAKNAEVRMDSWDEWEQKAREKVVAVQFASTAPRGSEDPANGSVGNDGVENKRNDLPGV
jgi:hypothetical protein